MSYILIDGYNLIGISHGNLEKARNNIIEELRKYAKIKDHQITLVFDGWKNGQRNETRLKSANLTVIYSRLGEKADQTIIKILSTSTKPWIVVSSDREISDFAAKRNFAAVSSDEFEEKLYSALHGSQNDDQDGGLPFDYPPARHKGNPAKLSKRRKKKLDALRKL